jgi:hypothetical protein
MSDRCPECEMETGHLGDCLVPYRARITALEADLARVTRERDDLAAVVAEKEADKDRMRASLAEARRERDEAEAALGATRTEWEIEARDLRTERDAARAEANTARLLLRDALNLGSEDPSWPQLVEIAKRCDDQREEARAEVERLKSEVQTWRLCALNDSDCPRHGASEARAEVERHEAAVEVLKAQHLIALMKAEAVASANGFKAGEAAGRGAMRGQALCLDQSWSVPGILARLADAADHLLHVHDCDHITWEAIAAARDAARASLDRIRALPVAAPEGKS